MSFEDHFSQQAQGYVKFRPGYPESLFSYLNHLCVQHDTAWDCATGNGQAAVQLAKYFKTVIATDASPQQIDYALPRPNITYSVAAAEKTQISAASIDLVTVATAYHWFDIPLFAQEVRRVLKPTGIIAVWGYNWFKIEPEIDNLVYHLNDHILVDFWPPKRQLLDQEYKTIDFPFTRIKSPVFFEEVMWDLSQMLGYLYTLSAVQEFINVRKKDPVADLIPKFSHLWGNPQTLKKSRFDLVFLAGKP